MKRRYKYLFHFRRGEWSSLRFSDEVKQNRRASSLSLQTASCRRGSTKDFCHLLRRGARSSCFAFDFKVHKKQVHFHFLELKMYFYLIFIFLCAAGGVVFFAFLSVVAFILLVCGGGVVFCLRLCSFLALTLLIQSEKIYILIFSGWSFFGAAVFSFVFLVCFLVVFL